MTCRPANPASRRSGPRAGPRSPPPLRPATRRGPSSRSASRHCQAFTWVASNQACWLKGFVAPAVPATGIVSGVRRGIEVNVDRAGSDLTSVDLPNPAPEECQRMCEANASCQAWVLTAKPSGIFGGDVNRCFLKSSVPGPSTSFGILVRRVIDLVTQSELQPDHEQLPERDVRRDPRPRHGQPAQPGPLACSQPVLRPLQRPSRVALAPVNATRRPVACRRGGRYTRRDDTRL